MRFVIYFITRIVTNLKILHDSLTRNYFARVFGIERGNCKIILRFIKKFINEQHKSL